jgi:hypothetical protein
MEIDPYVASALQTDLGGMSINQLSSMCGILYTRRSVAPTRLLSTPWNGYLMEITAPKVK